MGDGAQAYLDEDYRRAYRHEAIQLYQHFVFVLIAGAVDVELSDSLYRELFVLQCDLVRPGRKLDGVFDNLGREGGRE